MTDAPAKEGIEQYIPLVIPTVIAIIILYFLFLSPQQDQINGVKNELAVTNAQITNLTASKMNIGDNDGKFSLINSYLENLSSNQTFLAGKLQDFLNRIIALEQTASTTTASVNSHNQHFAITDGNITSLFGALSILNASYATNFTLINSNITDLQTQLTIFRNSTCGNYTDMLDWATSFDLKLTAVNTTLNNFMQTYLNHEAVLCAYNSSWC